MPKGIITQHNLGRKGRWANQLFQVMFLDTYARRNDLEVRIKPWVGYQFFNKRYPDADEAVRRLPNIVDIDETPTLNGVLGMKTGLSNFSADVYGQYPTSYYAPDRDYIRNEVFVVNDRMQQRLQPAVDKLYSLGDTVVGVHLRRGDYGQAIFPIVPTSWYLSALDRIWGRLKNPVMFMSTETPELVKDFAKYNPQTVDTLGVELNTQPLADYNYLQYDLKQQDSHQLDFFCDWYLLTKCSALLMPNSTFSFTAAMLNTCATEKVPDCPRFYRATLQHGGGFQMIDPWDSNPLQYENVNNYPDLWHHGIKLESNPYWK